jgi:probable rRNA maturation factor
LIRVLDESGHFDPPPGELSVAFLTETEMAGLHGRFLEDPTATDVITFDGDQDANNAGEICVCPDIAAGYAAEHELEFSEELALYIMHGYLHLCGFGDGNPSEQEAMRAAEGSAMSIAKMAGAIPDFDLRPCEH